MLHKLKSIEAIYTKITKIDEEGNKSYIVVAIQDIRKGATIIWEAIKGCFGSGFWRNTKGWINTEGWRNNK